MDEQDIQNLEMVDPIQNLANHLQVPMVVGNPPFPPMPLLPHIIPNYTPARCLKHILRMIYQRGTTGGIQFGLEATYGPMNMNAQQNKTEDQLRDQIIGYMRRALELCNEFVEQTSHEFEELMPNMGQCQEFLDEVYITINDEEVIRTHIIDYITRFDECQQRVEVLQMQAQNYNLLLTTLYLSLTSTLVDRLQFINQLRLLRRSIDTSNKLIGAFIMKRFALLAIHDTLPPLPPEPEQEQN